MTQNPMTMTDAEIESLEQIIKDFQAEEDAVGPADYCIVGIPDPLLTRLDAYRGGKTRPQAIRDILEEKLP